jgi:hypothetical protein
MLHKRLWLRLPAGILTLAALLTVSFAQSKRPLNHRDYDGWRSIVGQKLSNDGKFLAYGVFPQDGDGELIVRNLVTGKEQREPAGARPVAAIANFTSQFGPHMPCTLVDANTDQMQRRSKDWSLRSASE